MEGSRGTLRDETVGDGNTVGLSYLLAIGPLSPLKAALLRQRHGHRREAMHNIYSHADWKQKSGHLLVLCVSCRRATQLSADVGGVSTPCGLASTRRTAALVPGWFKL